jgi:hypothetical protein
MSIITDFFNWVTSNPGTAFTSGAILFTIYFGYETSKFQHRAAIRESLEQTTDVQMGRSKLKAVLKDYNSRFLRDPIVQVELKHYTPGIEPSSMDQIAEFGQTIGRHIDRNINEYDKSDKEHRDIVANRLNKIIPQFGCRSVQVNSNNVVLTMHSQNAVEIRDQAEEIIEWFVEFDNKHYDTKVDELNLNKSDFE